MVWYCTAVCNYRTQIWVKIVTTMQLPRVLPESQSEMCSTGLRSFLEVVTKTSEFVLSRVDDWAIRCVMTGLEIVGKTYPYLIVNHVQSVKNQNSWYWKPLFLWNETGDQRRVMKETRNWQYFFTWPIFWYTIFWNQCSGVGWTVIETNGVPGWTFLPDENYSAELPGRFLSYNVPWNLIVLNPDSPKGF